MRIKLGAVIPTHQYANLQPEIEVEAASYEEALAIAEAQLIPFWNKYVEGGKQLQTAKGKLIKGFVGGSIYYDDLTHTYTNEVGEVYLSSSAHAKTFTKAFDQAGIATATAKKHDVSVDDVIAMWELKAKISRDLGTALHEAIELRRRFEGLCKTMEKETHIHLSPMLKKPVDELMELLPVTEGEQVEALVIDHDNKRVGRVDLIKVVGTSTCAVIDYKTGDLDKSLDSYWEQLKFTSEILTKHGWKVSAKQIYHWDGQWKLKEQA